MQRPDEPVAVDLKLATVRIGQSLERQRVADRGVRATSSPVGTMSVWITHLSLHDTIRRRNGSRPGSEPSQPVSCPADRGPGNGARLLCRRQSGCRGRIGRSWAARGALSRAVPGWPPIFRKAGQWLLLPATVVRVVSYGVAQNSSTRCHSNWALAGWYSAGSEASVNRCPSPG